MPSFGASAQDASADRLISNGLKALKQIDEGHAEDVWDGAAPFVKERFSRAQLAVQLQGTRQAVGSVTQRTWAAVTRISHETATADFPAGLYGNVDFSTRLASGRTVFELVSFREDASGNWQLTGYTARQRQ